MKILHLVDRVDIGGKEMLLLDIINNYYTSKNHSIYVVILGDGALMDDYKILKDNCYFFKRKKAIDFDVIYKIRNLIKKLNIDVIHTHQPIEGVYSYLSTLGLKIKRVLSYHGFDFNDKIKDKITRMLLFHLVDVNVFVSNYLMEYYLRKYKIHNRKSVLLYNGVNQNRIRLVNNYLRKELNLKSDDILLGMVGNFTPGKSQITICEALTYIKTEQMNIYFVFVGGYTDNNLILYNLCYETCRKNNILKNVFFLGSRKDISGILNSLDIYVYSSNHDTFGITVVEAMLAGVPIICNNLPSLLEITKNGEYATIFETRNSIDLSKKIIFAIEQIDVLRKKAIEAKKWAQDNFTIEVHINNLNKIYNEVTGR